MMTTNVTDGVSSAFFEMHHEIFVIQRDGWSHVWTTVWAFILDISHNKIVQCDQKILSQLNSMIGSVCEAIIFIVCINIKLLLQVRSLYQQLSNAASQKYYLSEVCKQKSKFHTSIMFKYCLLFQCMIEVYSNTFDIDCKQYSSFFFQRITKSTQKALFCSASPSKM